MLHSVCTLTVPEPLKKWIDKGKESSGCSANVFVRTILEKEFTNSHMNEVRPIGFDMRVEKIDLESRCVTLIIPEEIRKSMKVKAKKMKVVLR